MYAFVSRTNYGYQTLQREWVGWLGTRICVYIAVDSINRCPRTTPKLVYGKLVLYNAEFSRICNFLNFAETIFADAVNVTPNVHNYTKIALYGIQIDENASPPAAAVTESNNA